MSDPLTAALRAGQRATDPDALRLVYGAVTATSPLRVKLDEDSTGLPITVPVGFTASVGNRVAVLVQGEDRTVLHRIT